jgi:branched-chain amino acid aminotransferase
MTRATSMKVWMGGRIVDGDEARIPVTDHGLLYGDGIFEGLRVYGRRIFRLGDHLHRFGAAAKAIGLELPGGLPAMERAVVEVARAYGRDEAYLRLVATRGSGELGVDPTKCKDPTVFCIADGIRLYDARKLEAGIDLVTVSVRRPAADALDPRVKSLNYLNSVLAKREAVLRGADEGLILNARGHIAEASVANVFAVSRGVLSTPPATDGALEGITRASVLDMAAELGIPTRESTLGRFDLFAADECFLTGTGARIVPVAALDGAPIGAGGCGPLTARLMEAFTGFASRHGTAF